LCLVAKEETTMAQTNTVSPTFKSKPEQFGLWLFEQSRNWRTVLAFLLIGSLTAISIRFNIELGRLSAVDETSKQLLPTGYALLDLAALFLSGYVGIRTRSPIRKTIAWVWFAFLLSLSLWAAAAFTMSVDYRQSLMPLNNQIDQKRHELETQQKTVSIWQKNVSEAVRFKTKHQATLNQEQNKEKALAEELAELESQRIPAAQIIYERAAPYVGLSASTLQLLIRLTWAAALTLSPIILALLIAVEFNLISKKPGKIDPIKRKYRYMCQGWIDTFRSRSPYAANSKQLESTVPSMVSETDSISSVQPIRNTDLKATNVPEQVRSLFQEPSSEKQNVPNQIHPQNSTRKVKKNPVRLMGVQHDSGTKGKAGHRYDDVKQQIILRKIMPSIRAIRKYCACNQEVASRYQKGLEKEGVIERLANGRYQLVGLRAANEGRAT